MVLSSPTLACGPTPQKVSREILIQAPPASVWLAVKGLAAVTKWHPDVESVTTKQSLSGAAGAGPFEVFNLKSSGNMAIKLREVPEGEMKLDYVMESGTVPVSNYRGILQVKAGEFQNQTLVVWSGRFNNKANTLDAPAGQDNATAVAAINRFYESGLSGLKKYIEAQ